MSSETITRNDLTNILNDVLPSAHYGSIYKASWTASSSSANNTPLTGDITIPAGTYAVTCISPIASANVSIAIAGQYKEMIKNGDSFTIIYSCNDTVTFHVSSAQSASVTFSYTERGSLTAIQISQQGVATNVADYIVEQGTSGDWHYRVWNSGFCELDGRKTDSFTFTNWGNLSYTATSFSALPFSLASIYSSSVAVWSQTVSCWAGLMTDGTFRIYSNSGAGGPHSITCVRHISGQKQ